MTSKLKFIETSKLPTDVGEFTIHAFTDELLFGSNSRKYSILFFVISLLVFK